MARNKQQINTLMGFDFDGTLTPIVSHPDKVKVPKEILKLLKNLEKRYGAHILILSGRSLSYLKKIFPETSFYLAGNHGFECEGPGIKYVHPQARQQAQQLKKIKKWVTPYLKPYSGCWLEDKKYTFSIHYRALPIKEHALFCRKLQGHLRAYPEGLKKMNLRPGKCVLEIRPQINWDKGKMYLWVQKKLKLKPKKDFFFYAGDDVTDEDVFKVMKPLNSFTVYVGSAHHKTKAQYRTKDTKSLMKLLKLLLSNTESGKDSL